MKCPTCESCDYAKYCGATEIMRKCERHNKKVVQTNEEWFIRLSTEDKAYFLNNVADACYYCGMKDIDNNKNCPFGKCRNNPQEIAEWLKQPHKEETE